MRKLMLLTSVLFASNSFSQKTKFVRSEQSKHKVVSVSDNHLKFDGRDYYLDIEQRDYWYQRENDSIIWVYGHAKNNWKDMVKVGFYNNWKNYVLSVKTEKLKLIPVESYAKSENGLNIKSDSLPKGKPY